MDDSERALERPAALAAEDDRLRGCAECVRDEGDEEARLAFFREPPGKGVEAALVAAESATEVGAELDPGRGLAWLAACPGSRPTSTAAVTRSLLHRFTLKKINISEVIVSSARDGSQLPASRMEPSAIAGIAAVRSVGIVRFSL